MASNSETFVLVQMMFGKPHPSSNALADRPANSIKRIVRTYLSASRASEDMELLLDAEPSGHFEVLTVTHIDN